eukprot:6251414-Karenia_brevis.AAC.1
MRARLTELRAPIYGTKSELWTRLVAAETRNRIRLEALEAARVRLEAQSLGQAPADVKEAPV